MIFEGIEYTIEKGVVKHKVSGGWAPENNLPTNDHKGAKSLDVVAGQLIVYCADGTEYLKRGKSHGWIKR